MYAFRTKQMFRTTEKKFNIRLELEKNKRF